MNYVPKTETISGPYCCLVLSTNDHSFLEFAFPGEAPEA